MAKTPFIFAGSIVATVIITITISSFFMDQSLPFEPTTPLDPRFESQVNELHTPQGIAMNSSGFFFVSDKLNHEIDIYNSTMQFVGNIGFPGDNPNDASLHTPQGVDVSFHDQLYVANSLGNNIKVFDPTGAFNFTIGIPGTGVPEFQGVPEFYRPTDVSGPQTMFDNIFVVDQNNHRVQMLDQMGDFVKLFE